MARIPECPFCGLALPTREQTDGLGRGLGYPVIDTLEVFIHRGRYAHNLCKPTEAEATPTHSPAPWAKNLRIIEDANGEEVARLSYERSGYVQANGNLIAAAPALAEALRRAIRGGRLIQAAFDGTDGADVPTVAATEIVGQGRAALAAAGIEA